MTSFSRQFSDKILLFIFEQTIIRVLTLWDVRDMDLDDKAGWIDPHNQQIWNTFTNVKHPPVFEPDTIQGRTLDGQLIADAIKHLLRPPQRLDTSSDPEMADVTARNLLAACDGDLVSVRKLEEFVLPFDKDFCADDNLATFLKLLRWRLLGEQGACAWRGGRVLIWFR